MSVTNPSGVRCASCGGSGWVEMQGDTVDYCPECRPRTTRHPRADHPVAGEAGQEVKTSAPAPPSTGKRYRRTLADAMADYFRAHAGEWINARVLAEQFGFAAWRTRVSDLRYPPFNLDVRNRQRHAVTDTGITVTITEYMLVGTVAVAAAATTDPEVTTDVR